MTTKRWKALTAALFGGLLAITWAGAAVAVYGPPEGHGEHGYGEGERLRDGSCLEMLGVDLEKEGPGNGPQAWEDNDPGIGDTDRLRDGSCQEE